MTIPIIKFLLCTQCVLVHSPGGCAEWGGGGGQPNHVQYKPLKQRRVSHGLSLCDPGLE